MGDEVESTTGGVFDDPVATRINRKYREVESSARSTVEAAIELGGMLLEKKEALPRGEWLPWVIAYFEGSERQAQRFMQLYRERDKLLQNPTRVSDLGFREALRAISAPPKGDQKEDRTKKLARKLRSSGFKPKYAKMLASDLVAMAAANEGSEEPTEPETIEVVPASPEAEKTPPSGTAEEEKRLRERTAKLDAQYAKEIANIKARYGDEAELNYLEISDEAWAEALANAKPARVKQASRLVNEIYTRWPQRMQEYLPWEAREAINDMDHGDAVLEALRYVQGWLERVYEGE